MLQSSCQFLSLSIKYSKLKLGKTKREQCIWKLTRKCNQSLRPKHHLSGQCFCINLSKFVKITAAECNSNLNHFTCLCLQRLCTIIAWFQQQQTKSSCTSCLIKSNQFIQKRRKRIHLVSRKCSYLCTTIEVDPYWSLDWNSSAAMLCLIFRCNTQQ